MVIVEGFSSHGGTKVSCQCQLCVLRSALADLLTFTWSPPARLKAYMDADLQPLLSPQELLCRASLETQKLELMSEVSSLKLKLNAIEKERRDLDRFGDSEVQPMTAL